jgi:hypothetical protein
MINLKKLRSVVRKFLKDSLHQFAAKHPDVAISCLGLFGQGYYGSVTAFADTSAHAQEKLRQYDQWLAGQKKDKASIKLMGKTRFRRWIQIMEGRGKDSMGRFNTSGNDFAYCIGQLGFADWPEPHTETEDEAGRWDFRWPDGRITKADTSKGDAGIDREVFPFLIECLESLDISRLKTEAIFRLGVEMQEETYVRFWVPRAMQAEGYQAYEYCYEQLGF